MKSVIQLRISKIITELNTMASAACRCSVHEDARCKACKAAGVLNMISEIAHGGLEELKLVSRSPNIE